MRSRSSTISSTSSCSSKKNVTQNTNNAMTSIEKNIVAEFVLKIYHDGLIRVDGLIGKARARQEFDAFDKVQQYRGYFADKNIGTLLRKHNFLFHTERGSGLYCIRMRNLFEYRNSKLKEMDESRIMGKPSAFDATSLSDLQTQGVIEESFEISPEAEEFPVVFRGGFEQSINPKFSVTVSGCYICQKNFKVQSDFEEHVEFHGFESDFEFLSSPGKKCDNIFEMIYRLVNKSHNFYFTMKTAKRDIIIEKIILIKTNMMHYIKANVLPCEIPSDGIDSFLIDSHLFTIGAEQPIVVVYRNKADKTTRFVEQHHFLRTEEFPQVHFNLRSCRIPYNSIMKMKCKLPEYEVEMKAMKDLKDQQFSNEALCNLSLVFRDFIAQKQVNERNAYDVLKTLNQIEDICAQSGYSQLSQQGVKIKRFGREYSVKLQKIPKGVFLENVLSPLDEIYLVAANKQTSMEHNANRRPKKSKVYRAVIERVYYNCVCFKYEGPYIPDTKTYNVTFRPSRLGLRYQYRALDIFKNNMSLRKYLHPLEINFQTPAPHREFELFNPSVKSNVEQLQAVQNIVDGPSSFAPYIIFGPPGTGKTSTVVEAVLQLWKQRPDTRILITAGSNAACDEVALRLCKIFNVVQPGERNILRIFAKSNEKRLDSIDEILIECSNFYRYHFYPSVDVIKEFRIIVCTLSVVGKLVSGGIGNDFFTHVFIDECAASTEPESMVGITGIFSMKTRLILSGDHKQLGPVLKSSVANDLGLKVSLMERLLNLNCYSVSSNGDYDRSIQSRLVKNFRSHSKIVELYNTLYYGGRLKSMVKDETVDLCSKWCRMPNKEYPIIFHAVYGSNHRNGHSISLSNDKEVEVVMDYVKDLLYFGIKGREISETDIGIISPYKKQYMRIQEELNRRRWFQIEVGAVETFQGKEKQIIIVSNVRSFTKTLGFLDNPKRLNVILSRAQSLLIMIGNPNTLSQNQDFKYIISECRKNNSALGSFRDIERLERRAEEEEFLNLPANYWDDVAEKTDSVKIGSTEQKRTDKNDRGTTEKKDKGFQRENIMLKKESSHSSKIENHLHTPDFYQKTEDLNIQVAKFVFNCLGEKQDNVGTQNLSTKVGPAKVNGSNYALRNSMSEDMVEISKRMKQLDSLSSSNSYRRNDSNIIANLKEHGKKYESQCMKVEPAKNILPMYSVRDVSRNNQLTSLSSSSSSARPNNSRSPLNNNFSEYSFNNIADINDRDRKYEKIVSLSSGNSNRRKESKCVLC